MKVYQFLDENEKPIGTVRAEHHEQAVEQLSNLGITRKTDFYSFEADDENK